MNLECERKFLVSGLLVSFLKDKKPRFIETGYFTNDLIAIRISLRDDGVTKPFSKICIKGPGTRERMEFEYTIPLDDAKALLQLAPTYLKKFRYDHEGWEIDHFPDIGLWMAEWEDGPDKGKCP